MGCQLSGLGIRCEMVGAFLLVRYGIESLPHTWDCLNDWL